MNRSSDLTEEIMKISSPPATLLFSPLCFTVLNGAALCEGQECGTMFMHRATMRLPISFFVPLTMNEGKLKTP